MGKPTIALRPPKPVAFPLAVAGMAMVTCVALEAAGSGDLLSPVLRDVTSAYVVPLSRLLFGESWATTVQVIAVLAWLAHLLESAYVVVCLLSVRSRGLARVSTATVAGYGVGVFIGGITHGARALADIRRAESKR